ncbi:hypothetical protein [uncultured Kordia sp.]|uniref:hypothetical protein n=1 Tax=uncultured Kordia sp. TaxID=507699 RepID=UPI002603FEA8|nr:hypothetical protein [uncultured Kordia sp.]
MTYTSLCKVTVSHTYYASNICECLRYQASQETTTMMNKYGFVLRLVNDGFELYTSSNQSIETHLHYITQVSGATSFEFIGTTTDPNFSNFTNIPINELGVLTFASDQTVSNNTSDTKIQLTETFVTDTTADKTIAICIKFEDLIRLQKTTSDISFLIQLQARETQWNYYIINNSNQEYNELAIEGSDKIQFTSPTETTLQNGQKALLFTSKTTKIPLKNEVTYTFDLVNTKQTISGDRKEVLIKGLPIPSPQNLQIQDDHTIASLIYVYI